MGGAICACLPLGRIVGAQGRRHAKFNCQSFNADGGGSVTGFTPIAEARLNFGFALVQVISQLEQVFETMPEFGLYDDDEEFPNAVALDVALSQNSSRRSARDGTVAVGRQLLDLLRDRPFSGAAITAVCAHEYGHIVQYLTVNDEINSLVDSDIRSELFADIASGYFAYHRKRADPTFPAVIQASTQFSFGDKDANGRRLYEPVSHGTEDQRGCCVAAGFYMGESGVSRAQFPLLALDFVRGLDLRSSACPV